MMRYPALLEGRSGAYGIVFPDLDGIVAAGATIDEVLVNAEEALRDYVIETRKDGLEPVPASRPEDVVVPQGSTLTMIPLILESGKPVRANLLLDEGVLAFIDSEARRRAMTRTAYIHWMTRRIASLGG